MYLIVLQSNKNRVQLNALESYNHRLRLSDLGRGYRVLVLSDRVTTATDVRVTQLEITDQLHLPSKTETFNQTEEFNTLPALSPNCRPAALAVPAPPRAATRTRGAAKPMRHHHIDLLLIIGWCTAEGGG
jgi:hypothetical protein